MNSLLSLLAYLLTGVAGIGIAAFVSSSLLAPSNAEVSEVHKPVVTFKVDEQVLIAQSPAANLGSQQNPQVGSTGSGEIANPPAASGRSDIVVEGQKQKELDLRFLQDTFEYNPEGKRDPFAPYEAPTAILDSAKPIGPVKPLQKYAVEQLRIQGIIWGVEDPIAMVEAPNNKIYYVREREKIGNNNGYVAQIREGEVVIVESFVHRGNITSQVKVLPLDKKKK